MTRPDNDNNYETKAKLLDRITEYLGGRVAEELVIKNISSGAVGDIKSLTQIAHVMVTELGMSDRIGPLFYGSEGEVFVGRSYQTQHSYSDEIANTIDEEVRSIVDSCHKRATDILTEKLPVLHNMARVLFERETIHNEEVQMLMDGKSAEEVIAYIDEQAKLFYAKHVARDAAAPAVEQAKTDNAFEDAAAPAENNADEPKNK